MTKISAQIIADSCDEFGNRITTMKVVFPRFILAELNVHRMFSINSDNSMDIPFEKMIKEVEEDPFIPIVWPKEYKGMQGCEYIEDPIALEQVISCWNKAKKDAIINAKNLYEGREVFVSTTNSIKVDSVTKQLCYILLEPFMWHTCIITAIEWENFFSLRCPKYSIFYENVPMEFRSKKDLKDFAKKVEANEFKNQYDNLTEIEWLQCNKSDTEIHLMTLAEVMWDVYNEKK